MPNETHEYALLISIIKASIKQINKELKTLGKKQAVIEHELSQPELEGQTKEKNHELNLELKEKNNLKIFLLQKRRKHLERWLARLRNLEKDIDRLKGNMAEYSQQEQQRVMHIMQEAKAYIKDEQGFHADIATKCKAMLEPLKQIIVQQKELLGAVNRVINTVQTLHKDAESLQQEVSREQRETEEAIAKFEKMKAEHPGLAIYIDEQIRLAREDQRDLNTLGMAAERRAQYTAEVNKDLESKKNAIVERLDTVQALAGRLEAMHDEAHRRANMNHTEFADELAKLEEHPESLDLQAAGGDFAAISNEFTKLTGGTATAASTEAHSAALAPFNEADLRFKGLPEKSQKLEQQLAEAHHAITELRKRFVKTTDPIEIRHIAERISVLRTECITLSQAYNHITKDIDKPLKALPKTEITPTEHSATTALNVENPGRTLLLGSAEIHNGQYPPLRECVKKDNSPDPTDGATPTLPRPR